MKWKNYSAIQRKQNIPYLKSTKQDQYPEIVHQALYRPDYQPQKFTCEELADRYFFMAESEKVAKLLKKYNLLPSFRELIELSQLNPAKFSEHRLIVESADFERVARETAIRHVALLLNIPGGKTKNWLVAKTAELAHLLMCDTWENLKDFQPEMIHRFLKGFRQTIMKYKKDAILGYFDNLSIGYLIELADNFELPQLPKEGEAPALQPIGLPKSDHDPRRISINPKSGIRKKVLCDLLKDYGYVKMVNQARGFFNADDQSGCRVKCPGSKRNEIGLLFDTLLKEKILKLSGGRGHWQVLQRCFVEETGDSLSSDFSKLVSKLKREKEQKTEIFDEINQFLSDLKKRSADPG